MSNAAKVTVHKPRSFDGSVDYTFKWEGRPALVRRFPPIREGLKGVTIVWLGACQITSDNVYTFRDDIIKAAGLD